MVYVDVDRGDIPFVVGRGGGGGGLQHMVAAASAVASVCDMFFCV